jgi:predicted DNA-binding protein with PD1-like motif
MHGWGGDFLRHQKTSFGHFLALEPGDELIRCLIGFAREHEVDAAVVSGIGSVERVELGYFNRSMRNYRRMVLDEDLEICSLNGNIALLDGAPYPHIHGLFSRADCTVAGGHVFEAVCSVTLELSVHTSPVPIERGRAEYNLNLLKLEDKP